MIFYKFRDFQVPPYRITCTSALLEEFLFTSVPGTFFYGAHFDTQFRQQFGHDPWALCHSCPGSLLKVQTLSPAPDLDVFWELAQEFTQFFVNYLVESPGECQALLS